MFCCFLAMLCGVAVDVSAAASDLRDEMKLSVLVRINQKMLREFYWDITHLKTASGEPLWQAIINLEEDSAVGRPCKAKVLDDALQTLIEDIANDDKRAKPHKKYNFLTEGMGCLNHPFPQSGCYWTSGFLKRFSSENLVYGAVRIARTSSNPFVPMWHKYLIFEGFPVQADDGMEKPMWWEDAPYWWCDLPE